MSERRQVKMILEANKPEKMEEDVQKVHGTQMLADISRIEEYREKNVQK